MLKGAGTNLKFCAAKKNMLSQKLNRVNRTGLGGEGLGRSDEYRDAERGFPAGPG